MNDGAAMAIRFNERISSGDLDGLAQLMSEDHTFIDTAGTEVIGKTACLEAWRGFFEAFPEYRNVFEAVSTKGNEIAIAGRSFCPGHPELEGPALWTIVVHGDQVVKWQVYEDTAEVRRRLGLGPPVV
jgi:ketosteroid isomerase-like protein